MKLAECKKNPSLSLPAESPAVLQVPRLKAILYDFYLRRIVWVCVFNNVFGIETLMQSEKCFYDNTTKQTRFCGYYVLFSALMRR